MSDMRVCSRCKVSKPIKEYYLNKARKDGLTLECGDCIRIRAKKWIDDNLERYKERYKIYYQKNKERYKKYYRDNRDNRRVKGGSYE